MIYLSWLHSLKIKNVPDVGIGMILLELVRIIQKFAKDANQTLMVQVRIENLLSLKSCYISIVFLIAVDFLTKFLANHFLISGVIVPMIPILDLLLMFNSGIAFSLLDFNNAFTSYGLSIIGVLLVIYLHAMLRNETSKANQFALTLILSGALGNILDRVIDGVVTDFLYFHIGDQSFFIFNFADAFISIGAAIFFISELKNYFGSSSHEN